MHDGLRTFWQSDEGAVFPTGQLDFHILIAPEADALHENAKPFEARFVAVCDWSRNCTCPPRVFSKGLDAKELHLGINVIHFILHRCPSQAPA